MNTKATYLLLAAFCVPFATAQSGSQKPVKGMASTVGLYVYPQKQQSATQQLNDEQQCYDNAKTQTGFDPNATTTGQRHPSRVAATITLRRKEPCGALLSRAPLAEILGKGRLEGQFSGPSERSAKRKSKPSRRTRRQTRQRRSSNKSRTTSSGRCRPAWMPAATPSDS